MANKKSIETGQKLRACRTRRKLSQQQVADALGVNRTTYTYYETGRSEPNLKTMVKLARIYEVDVSEILPLDFEETDLMDSQATRKSSVLSLSSDEQDLLLAYRSLSDEEKTEILEKITNMQK